MQRIIGPFLKLVCLGLALALSPASAAAATRGISVELRASEAPGAPVSETVRLYEKSYALVIGIDRYTSGWPRLSNAVKDATLVAEALEQRGFEVTLRTNLASNELKQAIEEFFIIKGAEPEARLFLWFAGHGHTDNSEGFLVPADAPSPEAGALFLLKALSIRRFGEYVRLAKSKHAFAVFDACFAGTVFSTQRSRPPTAITRATTLPVRQFLTSGDADQQVSDDGTFRKLFLRALAGEGRADASGDGYLTASELGLFLTDRMTNYTRGSQTPRYGKLRDPDYDRGDFVFTLPSLADVPKTPAPGMTAEIVFWESIKVSTNPGMFEAYLEQHPTGAFAALARAKLEELKGGQIAALTPPAAPAIAVEEMDATYVAVKTSNVRAQPSAQSEKVGRLVIDTAVSVTGKVEGKQWYRVAYAGGTAYVFAPLLKVVDAAEIVAWEQVKASKEAEKFESFLRVHPKGHFAERAKRLMALLRPAPAPVVPTPREVQPAVGVYPQTYEPGVTFKDCPECPEMVVVPGGSFVMGTPENEEDISGDEGPQHDVTIPSAFAVGKYEVTFDEWDTCVAAGGCGGYRPDDQGLGRGNRPVIQVSWTDAQSYVSWLGGKTRKGYRLLSESEWEYVARAGTATRYSWGDDIGSNRANCVSCGSSWDLDSGDRQAAPVGSFAANGLGIYDMAGNVAEWTEDCWHGGGASNGPVSAATRYDGEWVGRISCGSCSGCGGGLTITAYLHIRGQSVLLNGPGSQTFGKIWFESGFFTDSGDIKVSGKYGSGRNEYSFSGEYDGDQIELKGTRGPRQCTVTVTRKESGAYVRAPLSGEVWTSGGNCDKRVLRGGSWRQIPWLLRSSSRNKLPKDIRLKYNGFRVARTLDG